MNTRERLLDKVRALLSKTVENGCTEAEALSALAKARAMIDAYEITPEDLNLAKEQAAVFANSNATDDKHGIARYLMKSVCEFCDVEGWRRVNTFVFCGAPSDVQFAEWLHKRLIDFVRAELAGHLMKHDLPRGMRRRVINGFVLGCTSRIAQRVNALVLQSRQAAGSTSRALVLVKDEAIRQAMQERGIHLRTNTSKRRTDDASIAAGRAAGDRASFGRPIEREITVPRLR